MKKWTIALAVAVALGFALAACERGGGEASGKQGGIVAQNIDDGATPLDPAQAFDYLSKEPIKPEFYYDFKGKRIYFSSAETRDQFKQDPERYLKVFGISPVP